MLIVPLFTAYNKSNALEESATPTPNSNLASSVKIEEGRLAFKDLKSFDTYIMSKIDSQDKNSHNDFSSIASTNFKSYSSSSSVYIPSEELIKLSEKRKEEQLKNGEQITHEQKAMSDDTYIADSYLASILNEKRELAIGDSILRVGSDYVFMYKKGDDIEGVLNTFYNDVNNKSIKIPKNGMLKYKNLGVAKVYQQEITLKQNPKEENKSDSFT